jgi:leucyl aminopeptidase
MPSNEKRPEQFAREIADRAEARGLEVTVLGEEELRAEKFGAMLAVAGGSQGKPRLVIAKYKSPGARRTVALVGKGVTFDAGGLNLKPTGSMEDMKMDMSGAAAVAATLLTVAQLKPKINVVGVMPLVENMPSGSAYRPGDIFRTYEGKTVEIGNTDAEGRLILIDAMAYTVKNYKPHFMIDMATLTGACVIALGEKIAGLFSPDDELAAAITAAAERTHERCWRMPLPADYQELLKSDFADLNNISRSRWGGAITAALFLKEFVAKTRWAHIDIAGPAMVKKEQPYCVPGGTGFGVRLLTEVVRNL